MNLIRPLVWPANVPRTKNRRHGRFAQDRGNLTVAAALDRLEVELDRFGAILWLAMTPRAEAYESGAAYEASETLLAGEEE